MKDSDTADENGQTTNGCKKELILTPNISDGDGFYDELLLAHKDLSKTDSDAFNARLVLLLCNHIGDRHIIRQALSAAATAKNEHGISAEKKP